jgi:hypothetical protein
MEATALPNAIWQPAIFFRASNSAYLKYLWLLMSFHRHDSAVLSMFHVQAEAMLAVMRRIYESESNNG